jgi:hypothetical protein
MRRAWLTVCLLLAMSGCLAPQKKVIKAPPHDEEFNVPPDDSRFSNPPQYPKGTLNKDTHKKDDDDDGTGKLRMGSNGQMSPGF